MSKPKLICIQNTGGLRIGKDSPAYIVIFLTIPSPRQGCFDALFFEEDVNGYYKFWQVLPPIAEITGGQKIKFSQLPKSIRTQCRSVWRVYAIDDPIP